jgi:hypothetical protein
MTDHLFESGCCLCSLSHWRPGVSKSELSTIGAEGPRELSGLKYCGDCLDSFNWNYRQMHAEITRRKALASAPKAAGLYGTQPSELPATLPAGTRWRLPTASGSAFDGGAFVTAAKGRSDWDDNRYAGDCIDLDGKPFLGRAIKPERICWESVPIAPPAPEQTTSVNNGSDAPARVAPSGGDSGLLTKPDPYAAHAGHLFASFNVTEKQVGERQPGVDDKRRTERIAALSASSNTLDRRAARIRSLRLDLDSGERRRAFLDKMGKLVSWTGPISKGK